VVLGTLITYQAAYWLWLKLGSIDEGNRSGGVHYDLVDAPANHRLEKLAELEKQLVHAVNERRRDGKS
jgi:hypothetical protein